MLSGSQVNEFVGIIARLYPCFCVKPRLAGQSRTVMHADGCMKGDHGSDPLPGRAGGGGGGDRGAARVGRNARHRAAPRHDRRPPAAAAQGQQLRPPGAAPRAASLGPAVSFPGSGNSVSQTLHALLRTEKKNCMV